MAFKVLFMAHSPDADKDRHRSVIETGKYKLFTVVLKSQSDAVTVAKEIFAKENIDSIILCPGFTHEDVSDLFRALQGKVSINVARGDGPSTQMVQAVIKREFAC